VHIFLARFYRSNKNLRYNFCNALSLKGYLLINDFGLMHAYDWARNNFSYELVQVLYLS
jgi:hypothetical protein